MKQFLSLFMFGIGGLLFLAFVTTLKPTVVTAASGPGKPGQCSTKAPSFVVFDDAGKPFDTSGKSGAN